MSTIEGQYLEILRTIRRDGRWKDTRQIDKKTGGFTRTKGIPGAEMRVRIAQEGFPLLSVRPFTRALHLFIGEMLWIISGSNLAEDLHRYGVHYWDDWIAPDWLTDEKRAEWNMPVGSFGFTYGPAWRRYPGPSGVTDQLKVLFKSLRNNPADKRMRVIPWHPELSQELVVRPCHGDVYVYCAEGELSIIVNQMSADMPIGVPSNLAMYGFFQLVLCQIFGFEPGTYLHRTMDTHYYSNQEKGVDVLCDERVAQPLPRLTIDPIVAEMVQVMVDNDLRDPLSTETFNPERLPYKEWLEKYVVLHGYTPQKAISSDILPVAI